MILTPDHERKEETFYSPWRHDGGAWSVVDGIFDVPHLRREAERFASAPVQAIEIPDEVLSVLQGEVAAVQPGDGPIALGSDSATTCHIVGFRNPASGRTCLAHLDSCNRLSEAIGCMLARVSGHGGGGGGSGGDAPPPEQVAAAEAEPLDLYIVGGYLGETTAEDLSNALLSELHASRKVFRLVLACMSRLNSVRPATVAGGTALPHPPRQAAAGKSGYAGGSADGHGRGGVDATSCGNEAHSGNPPAGAGQTSACAPADTATKTQGKEAGVDSDSDRAGWLPRRTGLAIDLSSGRAFPVRFEGAARGAGWDLRHVRMCAGPRETPLAEFYDAPRDNIFVAPFPLWANPSSLRHLIALSDRELLVFSSTSPDAEDERFVQDMRSQFLYILGRVGPDGGGWWESVFGGGRGRPLIYPRVAPAPSAGPGARLF